MLIRTLPLLAAIACAAGGLHAADKRPNVLFLLTDDQRPDTIAALGNAAIRTPNLDALARRGFAFTNAYCMGSTMPAVCNPSRHMIHSGMSLYRYQPRKAEGTLGDVLRKAGYVTYHQSKGGNVARAYDAAYDFSSYLKDEQERTSGHHGRAAADSAIAFLKTKWDRGKPLLMCIGFEGPHDPRVAAQQWMDLYDREQLPIPANFRPFHPIDNGALLIRDEQLAPWPRTETAIRKHLHDYYGCISSLDFQIGRILQTLKDLGQYDNTIIVFSSDHGLAIGSHGLMGKQNLYEHSMRSPLIFAGPGVRHGTSDAFAYLFDIFPTICDLAGVAAPRGLDGQSLAPIIRGERQSVREAVFLAYMDSQRAVRRGQWKLIRYPLVDYTMLFNLRHDPHELNNLAQDAAFGDKAGEMLKLLAAQQKAWGDRQPLAVEHPRRAEIGAEFFK